MKLILYAGAFSRKGKFVNEDFFESDLLSKKFSFSFEQLSAHECLFTFNPEGSHIVRQFEDYLIVGDVNIYNRTELISLLDLPYTPVASLADIDLLLRLYIQFNNKFLDFINGDFAVCIYDKQKAEISLFRDHLGMKPLYFYVDDDWVLFSNRIFFLSQFTLAEVLDEEWILDYLMHLNTHKDKTIFKKISRLPPAHTLTISRSRKVLAPYWQLDNGTIKSEKSDSILLTRLEEALLEAVNCRLPVEGSVGLELSGGIDSSAVAAFIRKCQPGIDIIALSDVAPSKANNEEQDEWRNAQEVSSYLNISHHIRIEESGSPSLELLRQNNHLLGYPSCFFFTTFQQGLYVEAQQHQVNLLFSGFGGDEAVTQQANGRYFFSLLAEVRLWEMYKYYRRVHEFSRSKSIFKFLRTLYNFFTGKEPRYYHRTIKEWWSTMILNPKYLRLSFIKRHYFQFSLFPANQTIRQRTLFHLAKGSLVERLETSSIVAASRNLAYRYPLLDKKLLETYFSISDDDKASDPGGRGLIRAILRSYLPHSIVSQQKSAFPTIPFFVEEMKTNFDSLKQFCLNAAHTHWVYKYVDRSKLMSISKSDEDLEMNFDYLQIVTSLMIFYDDFKSTNFKQLTK